MIQKENELRSELSTKQQQNSLLRDSAQNESRILIIFLLVPKIEQWQQQTQYNQCNSNQRVYAVLP